MRRAEMDARPHRGWIRAVRDALGMSAAELGRRMNVGQSAVAEMERSEASDSIRLNTLRRAAVALECDLVYVLVPKTSLEGSVRAQARRRASAHIRNIAQHSQLENQAVAPEESDAQIEDLVRAFVDHRGLWSADTPE